MRYSIAPRAAYVAVNDKTEDCVVLFMEDVSVTRTRDKELIDAAALVRVRPTAVSSSELAAVGQIGPH